MGHPGAILEPSWGHPRAILGHLGPLWGHLGPSSAFLGLNWIAYERKLKAARWVAYRGRSHFGPMHSRQPFWPNAQPAASHARICASIAPLGADGTGDTFSASLQAAAAVSAPAASVYTGARRAASVAPPLFSAALEAAPLETGRVASGRPRRQGRIQGPGEV